MKFNSEGLTSTQLYSFSLFGNNFLQTIRKLIVH